MRHQKSISANHLLLALLVLLAACSSPSAKVRVKFDISGGDNSFSATVYAQEIISGKTYSSPYDPHTPYIIMNLASPGEYVFYARLVEVPDDYHYGFTSYQTVGYGHMTRGGVGQPEGLAALAISAGKSYKVYINDFRAVLPEKDKPVIVPWYEILSE